ncbi:hypothetical protein MPL3356_110097 [Mesorhizobium plurifarium]|uniref:Uncharacterized protein n=1 Tax=Mesorhizobium plurifarium TaxID=69974 RepID=A0A090D9N3_MESPL|nr:hypothetical protein MPL3356_110097 [Mesorhizobium plurifarium]
MLFRLEIPHCLLQVIVERKPSLALVPTRNDDLCNTVKCLLDPFHGYRTSGGRVPPHDSVLLQTCRRAYPYCKLHHEESIRPEWLERIVCIVMLSTSEGGQSRFVCRGRDGTFESGRRGVPVS